MRKYLILVPLAVFGMVQAGCDSIYNGHGIGGPVYFEGAPYYGGHDYYKDYNQKGDYYYGDKDIGMPYYLVDDVMYYEIGGCYCYYRNHMRYYVKTIPPGGRYVHVMKSRGVPRHDTSK
jgi:hypothetical protein